MEPLYSTNSVSSVQKGGCGLFTSIARLFSFNRKTRAKHAGKGVPTFVISASPEPKNVVPERITHLKIPTAEPKKIEPLTREQQEQFTLNAIEKIRLEALPPTLLSLRSGRSTSLTTTSNRTPHSPGSYPLSSERELDQNLVLIESITEEEKSEVWPAYLRRLREIQVLLDAKNEEGSNFRNNQNYALYYQKGTLFWRKLDIASEEKPQQALELMLKVIHNALAMGESHFEVVEDEVSENYSISSLIDKIAGTRMLDSSIELQNLQIKIHVLMKQRESEELKIIEGQENFLLQIMDNLKKILPILFQRQEALKRVIRDGFLDNGNKNENYLGIAIEELNLEELKKCMKRFEMEEELTSPVGDPVLIRRVLLTNLLLHQAQSVVGLFLNDVQQHDLQTFTRVMDTCLLKWNAYRDFFKKLTREGSLSQMLALENNIIKLAGESLNILHGAYSPIFNEQTIKAALGEIEHNRFSEGIDILLGCWKGFLKRDNLNFKLMVKQLLIKTNSISKPYKSKKLSHILNKLSGQQGEFLEYAKIFNEMADNIIPSDSREQLLI